MKLRQWSNIFQVIINTNPIVQHVIEIKNEMMINVNVSIKSTVCTKHIIVIMLAHVFVRIVGI